MNKLRKDDISPAYFAPTLNFNGLERQTDIDDLEVFRANDTHQDSGEPLTLQELTRDGRFTESAASKIIAVQSGILSSLRQEIETLSDCTDRYLTIKPSLQQKNLDTALLAEYVYGEFSKVDELKEFNPPTQALKSLAGVLTSCVIFAALTALGLSQHPLTNSLDYFSLGIIAFIWLGFTWLAACNIPRRYRTRKVIYQIIKNGHK